MLEKKTKNKTVKHQIGLRVSWAKKQNKLKTNQKHIHLVTILKQSF